MISTECIDIIYGCEYLPDSINVSKFLSFVFEKYNCDIIFLKSENVNYLKKFKKNIDFDIQVCCVDSCNCNCDIIKELKDDYGNIIFDIDKNNTKSNVLELYRRIIRTLK